MKRICQTTIVLVLLMIPSFVAAQDDDFGIWYSVRATKIVAPKLSGVLEQELRLRDNTRETDCWAEYAEITWSALPFLKTGVGYTLIQTNKVDYGWQTKHRFNAFVTGSLKVNAFTFSVRERLQQTVTPGASPKTVWRSRLQITYSPTNSKLSPYAHVESYYITNKNSEGLEKIRYTMGFNYSLNERLSLGSYYRYIDHDNSNADEHIMGLGCVIKL